MRILLTSVESRKAFDVANIYENVYGWDVILASSATPRSALTVVYGREIHRLSDESYDQFENDLTNILNGFPNEEIIYIPVSETYTLFLYRFLKTNQSARLSSLLPSAETFAVCRTKSEFQEFCERRGLPVPRSYSSEQLGELRIEFKPVVAKRKVGSGSVGMKVINSAEDLALLNQLDLDDYLIQEKVNSSENVHGAFFLVHNGAVVGYHGHRRVRTFPEGHGVTVYSKAEYNHDVRRIGETLLRELDWNGLAMVECMYDELSSEWKIIELNPRIWGSIMLTEYCGAHILGNYVRLCLGKETVESEVDTEASISWIFPFEILNVLRGKIKISELLNMGRNKICYINFTYSSWYRTLSYLIYLTLSTRSMKRFVAKIGWKRAARVSESVS